MSETDLTVGDLIRQLKIFDLDSPLHLPGDLNFYRVRDVGGQCVLEVGEALADLTEEFKKRNPHVKAAFIRSESDPNEMVSGPFGVSVD